MKSKVFEQRCPGVQGGLVSEDAQGVKGTAGVECGDLMESATQVVRGESKIFVGEEGSNFVGKAVGDQRKSKTFLAGERANVCWFGGEGRAGVQLYLKIVGGSYED